MEKLKNNIAAIIMVVTVSSYIYLLFFGSGWLETLNGFNGYIIGVIQVALMIGSIARLHYAWKRVKENGTQAD